MRYVSFLLLGCACFGQEWEIGAGAGYGVYRNGTIISAAGKAPAGVRNRFVLSMWAEEDISEHIGGEVRYQYHDGHPFLSGKGTITDLQGESHSFHYDILVYLRERRQKLRPYLAAGIGAKLYHISGPPNPAQPLANIGVLTTTDQVQPLITLGGGVRYELHRHVAVRIEFLDYMTPFPKKYIAPAPYATARGILQQFTPLAGIGYTF